MAPTRRIPLVFPGFRQSGLGLDDECVWVRPCASEGEEQDRIKLKDMAHKGSGSYIYARFKVEGGNMNLCEG